MEITGASDRVPTIRVSCLVKSDSSHTRTDSPEGRTHGHTRVTTGWPIPQVPSPGAQAQAEL